jgi:hypothetical protein
MEDSWSSIRLHYYLQKQAAVKNANSVGKYIWVKCPITLVTDIDAFLPQLLILQNECHHTPKLIRHIQKILNHPLTELNPPNFKFSPCPENADDNFDLLKTANFDLQHALSVNSPSLCQPGSEFHATSILEPLLVMHPLWKYIKTYHSDSYNYVIRTSRSCFSSCHIVYDTLCTRHDWRLEP